MEANGADSGDVLGGAITLTLIADGTNAVIQKTCAQPSIGTCSWRRTHGEANTLNIIVD